MQSARKPSAQVHSVLLRMLSFLSLSSCNHLITLVALYSLCVSWPLAQLSLFLFFWYGLSASVFIFRRSLISNCRASGTEFATLTHDHSSEDRLVFVLVNLNIRTMYTQHTKRLLGNMIITLCILLRLKLHWIANVPSLFLPARAIE